GPVQQRAAALTRGYRVAAGDWVDNLRHIRQRGRAGDSRGASRVAIHLAKDLQTQDGHLRGRIQTKRAGSGLIPRPFRPRAGRDGRGHRRARSDNEDPNQRSALYPRGAGHPGPIHGFAEIPAAVSLMLSRLAFILCVSGMILPATLAQKPEAEGALAGAGPFLAKVKSAGVASVQCSGVRSFKEEEIRAAIGEQVREIDEKGVSPARADDAAYYVATFYRKAGFSKVETSFQITGKQVIVRINEGPRTLLRGLKFPGNRACSDDALFEYMIGAKKKRLEKEPKLFPYNQNEVNAGADRVRGFYVSEGYLDAVVDASNVTLSRDGRSATVVVKIEERTRYTFGEIQFEGQTLYSRNELIAATREKTDGPFSRAQEFSM